MFQPESDSSGLAKWCMYDSSLEYGKYFKDEESQLERTSFHPSNSSDVETRDEEIQRIVELHKCHGVKAVIAVQTITTLPEEHLQALQRIKELAPDIITVGQSNNVGDFVKYSPKQDENDGDLYTADKSGVVMKEGVDIFAYGSAEEEVLEALSQREITNNRFDGNAQGRA